MEIIETEIEGVRIVEPQVFGDPRGWFVEQYNAERYKAAGIDADFVQDNESFSSKGVVRGLHWQRTSASSTSRGGSPTVSSSLRTTRSSATSATTCTARPPTGVCGSTIPHWTSRGRRSEFR